MIKRAVMTWLLAIGLLGCQAPAPAAAPPPAPEAPAPPPAPPPVSASTAIWGEVPRQICTCHEDALSRVETDLQDSQLAVQFKIESGNEGWHIFSVTFDPTRVPADEVTHVLKSAGALIIPAPVGP